MSPGIAEGWIFRVIIGHPGGCLRAMAKTFQRATICAVMQSGGTERDRSGVPFEKRSHFSVSPTVM